jgi:hypothetical protein
MPGPPVFLKTKDPQMTFPHPQPLASAPSSPARLDDGFDREVVHVMTFTAADAGAALAAVRDELVEAGADLSGLSLYALDARVEGVLRLTNLTCARARDCSDRLSSRPGVFGARVEHHLYRS